MSTPIELAPEYMLPDWMRLAQRGFDWGLLLVLALCVVVSAPFLLHSEIQTTNSTENYIYRTDDYATAIQEGWLYPRWSPHVLGGYGAPIPNFYAPAAPYTAAIFQVLLTNSATSAVRLTFVIAICLAGLATYVLVMPRSGAVAGILAAMLYVYSPYVSLTVPHLQGDLPHIIVLALTPALLWSTDRLIRNNQPQNTLLMVLFSASLLLTDIKGAGLAYLLAASYTVWQAAANRSSKIIIQFIFCILLGILVAGFYWIPALLEQTAIRWQPNGARPIFRLNHFEMISPIRPIDPAEMVAHPQFTIGLTTFLYVFCGTLTYIFLKKYTSFGGFFITAGVVITGIAIIFVPTETNLLGLIVLCAAIGSSEVTKIRTWLPTRPRRLILPIMMVTIWISSIAIWSPPQASETFDSATGLAQINYEQQGYGVAVLPAGDAIPSSLPFNLAPSRSLIDSYAGGTINKLAPGQTTGGFRASPILHVTQGDEFQLIQASTALPLNILTAYFPGWQAHVGEQSLSVQPNSDTGLIQVAVPIITTNNAELAVTFGTTNVRYGSWLIAGIALLVTLLLSWIRFRQKRRVFIEDIQLLRLDEVRLIALPICCFALVTVIIFFFPSFINRVPPTNFGLRNSFSTQIRSTAGLNLNAFRLETNVYKPHDAINLTLFWQTQRFLAENYLVKVFLVNNSDGKRWNETQLRNPGFYPTKRWNTQQYVSDYYQFAFENGISPGNYQIHVEAYACRISCTDEDRLIFYDARGQTLGADLTLPTLISIQP